MARFARLARFNPVPRPAARIPPRRIGREGRALANDPPAAPPRAAQSDETAYHALHAERAMLERDLALAKARQSFSKDADEVARARAEEATMLSSLDMVLTRIRATEYRRRPGARRW